MNSLKKNKHSRATVPNVLCSKWLSPTWRVDVTPLRALASPCSFPWSPGRDGGGCEPLYSCELLGREYSLSSALCAGWHSCNLTQKSSNSWKPEPMEKKKQGTKEENGRIPTYMDKHLWVAELYNLVSSFPFKIPKIREGRYEIVYLGHPDGER